MLRLSIFILIIIQFQTIFETSKCFTQEQKFGILSSYNLNSHNTDFRKLPNIPNCCPHFESGSGSGFSVGMFYEYPLTNSLYLTTRALYSDYSAELLSDEPSVITVIAQSVDAKIRHSITANLASINFEPILAYNIFQDLIIYSGLSAGIVITKSFRQEETLLEPVVNGAFENGLRIRNIYSGDLPEASSLAFSAIAGISYELPLNKTKTLRLAPSIEYYYGLSQIIKDYSWSANSAHAVLAIKYVPALKKTEIQEHVLQQFIRDTIIISRDDINESYFHNGLPRTIIDTSYEENLWAITERTEIRDTLFKAIKPELLASIIAKGINSGVEEDIIRIKIEEFLSIKMLPLLNYIFFEHNSASLPERYTKLNESSAKDFSIDNLFDYGTLDAYLHVLNIIGKRMLLYPDSKITLTGCNSGINEEKNNQQLSLDRANAVKSYLVGTWNIKPERITVNKRDLPLKPSNSSYDDGIEENRRVEFSSKTAGLLAPVIMNDTLRTVNPPVIRFYTDIKSKYSVSSWKLTVSQKGNEMKSFSGTVLPETIDWNIDDDKINLPRFEDDLIYSLSITDNKGNIYKTDDKIIPINQMTITKKREDDVDDRRIDNYSLILFDFNSSELGHANMKIIDFIKKNVSDNSKVFIEGFTDRTGEETYNLDLSLARAKQVGDAMKTGNIISKGSGNKRSLHDNDLPEGRFYCRTVTIQVETSLKK